MFCGFHYEFICFVGSNGRREWMFCMKDIRGGLKQCLVGVVIYLWFGFVRMLMESWIGTLIIMFLKVVDAPCYCYVW